MLTMDSRRRAVLGRHLQVALRDAAPAPVWRDSVEQMPNCDSLAAPKHSDVVIVGAGFTGLWTALALKELDPSTAVTVLEAARIGSGASGKNGGWASALLPVALPAIDHDHGPGAARLAATIIHSAAADLHKWATAQGVSGEPGGMVYLARNAPQAHRLVEEITTFHRYGLTEYDYRWLDAADAFSRVHATRVHGGLYSPHCAAVNPMLLLHALASQCLKAGVVIRENTPVVEIRPHAARTRSGAVRGEVIIRATEAYTPRFEAGHRCVAPIYSLVVATQPLAAEQWTEIGLATRECFTDGRRAVIYGQRTADDRLVFGGRGAPYHWGSRTSAAYDQHRRTHRKVVETLWDLFPSLIGTPISHCWGGAVAVSRDWYPSISFDPHTALGSAGGYAGDGVTFAYLAGQTLAELILGRDSPRTQAPWVNHASPTWEVEPLRWLGINAAVALSLWADRAEDRRDRPARVLSAALGALGA